jgi:dihydroorotate dehydrogenase
VPDWTYQTVFRPLLSRFSYPTAQRIVFGTLGALGRVSIGRWLIRMMGHAAPPADAALRCGSWDLISPVALGAGIDQQVQATSALSLFGFGILEVGPVAGSAANRLSASQAEPADWDRRGSSVQLDQTKPLSVANISTRLKSCVTDEVLVIARLLPPESAVDLSEQMTVCRALDSVVDGFSLTASTMPDGSLNVDATNQMVAELCDASQATCWLIRLPCGVHKDDVSAVVREFPPGKACGIVLEVSRAGDARAEAQFQDLVAAISAAHEKHGTSDTSQVLVAVRAAVTEPAEALVWKNLGADVVFVDQGLIEAGPGLPKRVNAAVAAAQRLRQTAAETPRMRRRQQHVSRAAGNHAVVKYSWFWLLLMSVGLLTGGVMAMVLGVGRVLLPYDEEFLGMVRDEICGINDNLLPFMSHDRVTLAGTMLALGTIYLALCLYGDRRGMHWARVTVLSSGMIGFLSFFLFLGFGYFDPFHAFVTCIMFQFLAIGLRSELQPCRLVEFDLRNSPSWRAALWGQLLLVLHGIAVLAGGIVICTFGVTTVFVEDDLEFMQTTVEYLAEANPRLVPLVAHDRASFGGMLISCGLAVLLTAVWGWQRGRRWLWTALAVGGTLGYGATIAIHWHVGYTSLRHLVPAYAGMVSLWLALGLSWHWMFEDASTANA